MRYLLPLEAIVYGALTRDVRRIIKLQFMLNIGASILLRDIQAETPMSFKWLVVSRESHHVRDQATGVPGISSKIAAAHTKAQIAE